MKGSLHYTLERHIFHLLFQEDSVDVPGFGRLEAQRFGAEIQLQSGLFLPPARRLSFSPVAGKSELPAKEKIKTQTVKGCERQPDTVAQATDLT